MRYIAWIKKILIFFMVLHGYYYNGIGAVLFDDYTTFKDIDRPLATIFVESVLPNKTISFYSYVSVDSSELNYDNVQSRTMHYLLVCNEDEASQIHTKNESDNYCTNGKYTDQSFCHSFPLYVSSGMMYHASAKVSYKVNTGNSKLLAVYLTNCEVVGGEDGLLRSCKNNANDKTKPNPYCFQCLKDTNKTNSNCIISPQIKTMLTISFLVDIRYYEDASMVYAIFAIIYTILAAIWLRILTKNISNALQRKMTSVLIAEIFFLVQLLAYIKCESLYDEYRILSTLLLISHCLSEIVLAEVMILIAKGWLITRHRLSNRELRSVYFLLIFWGLCLFFISGERNRYETFYSILSGICYLLIIFIIWHNTTLTLRWLKFQMDLMAPIRIITSESTPLNTKFLSIFSFYLIFTTYIITSTIARALIPSSSVLYIKIQEIVKLLLIVGIGYIFRCHEFIPLPSVINETLSIENTNSPTQEHHLRMQQYLMDPTIQRNKTFIVVNPTFDKMIGTTTVRVQPSDS